MRSDFSLNNNNNNKEKTVMEQKNTRKKRHLQNEKKEETKAKKGRGQLLFNCVWLPGRMHIEERRTIERRAAV